MQHPRYAITALEIRPRTALPPEELAALPVIGPFFPAGGAPGDASPTQCRAAVVGGTLLLHFTCTEGPVTLRPDGTGPMARQDRVEVALRGRALGQWDFVVLAVERGGAAEGFLETGMTYLGGGEAYSGGPDRKDDQGVRTPLPPASWTAERAWEDGAWTCRITVPLSCFGAAPGEAFAMQLYRKKHQTSEILCPVPLDLNVNYSDRFEYDPLTFFTVRPGETDRLCRAEGVFAPGADGVGRWIRPGLLTRPAPELTARIAAWREEDDLGALVELAQAWQDVLTLDGVDFFFNQAIAHPWPFREPWVERIQFNLLLAQGDEAAARARLSAYLLHLEQLTAWWYADHTLGNASPAWENPGALTAALGDDGCLALTFSGGAAGTLCVAAGGLRLSLLGRGYFDAAPTPLRPCEGGWEADGHRIQLTAGVDWEIRFDGATVLAARSLELWREAGTVSAVSATLPLPPRGAVTGFGERFDSCNQRGKRLFLYQRDSCEGCLAGIGNQSYKNIPLITAEHGFTAFFNHHAKLWADVGCGRADGLRLVADDPFLDLFYWAAPPAQALGHYAALTGMPLLPPRWALEPWAGGGAGRWLKGPLGDLYREQHAVLERFAQEDIPHSGFYAEGAGAGWFGPAKKEELYKIVAAGEKRGIRVFSWQFPNMSLAMAKELLPDCPEADLPVTKAPAGLPTYIDFTHPNAPRLLRAQWRDRLDAGIRGSMVDFGDVVPEAAQFYDGRTGKTMHNGYAITYARAYREMFEARYGADHVLFTRGAGAGSQAYACQFAGDHRTSFLGLRFTLCGGVTAAMSGLPFWGGDAGGYDGFADEETYLRWTAFACFNPLMRYHGTEPREPWAYSDFAVAVYRRYAWLRENLLPYLWHHAVLAHETGLPILRPMAAAAGEQLEDWIYNSQYFFGEAMVVAPVLCEGAARDVWLPPGRWYGLLDGQMLEGGRVYRAAAPIDQIPVYLRAGAAVPLALNENLNLGSSMTTSRCRALLLTAPAGRARGQIHLLEGGSLSYDLSDGAACSALTLSGRWEGGYLLLRGFGGVEAVTLGGRKLPKAANRGGLLLDEGWCELENGDLAVRLWPGSCLQISMEKGDYHAKS